MTESFLIDLGWIERHRDSVYSGDSDQASRVSRGRLKLKPKDSSIVPRQ